ncbi:Major facilitator, sugar transporter-like, partial [Dillenia turbinata]
LIVGRIFVRLSVGMASEAPAKIRGALVSTNGFLITSGQFLCYQHSPYQGKYRIWANEIRHLEHGVGCLELLELCLKIVDVDSPRVATLALSKANEVEKEIHDLKNSIETDIQEEGTSEKISLIKLIKTKRVRRGLITGVGLTTLLSRVTAGLNATGPIVSIYFIDRTGRKKLLIISLIGVILSLGLLSAVFHQTSRSPPVSAVETSHFAANYTCPDYSSPGVSANWDCMKCLKATSPNCGLCASSTKKLFPGVCLLSNNTVKYICHGEHRPVYKRMPEQIQLASTHRPSSLYNLLLSRNGHSPMDSELRDLPTVVRGVCGGIAATANWVSKLIVAQSFLSFNRGHWNLLDISHMRNSLRCGTALCPNL